MINPTLNLIDDFIRQFEELDVLLHNTFKEKSEIDKKVSAWYHKVEGTTITHVSQSHNMMKEIKPILQRRREIKIEEIILRSTCDTLRVHINSVKGKKLKALVKNEEVLEEIIERAKE